VLYVNDLKTVIRNSFFVEDFAKKYFAQQKSCKKIKF
jgi:hypothetical protein